MSQEAQLLCMMAGANSIFFGEKLLTTGSPEFEQDMALLKEAGIQPLEPARHGHSCAHEVNAQEIPVEAHGSPAVEQR